MMPLAAGLCLDYYVVGRLVVGKSWIAWAAIALFGVLVFFWMVFPASRRLHALLDR
jgi:hypothetical protein